MPLTNEVLKELEDRNKKRKKLKGAASPGPWVYESHGMVHQYYGAARKEHLAILIRPENWFTLISDKIDKGFSPALAEQTYLDGSYIAEARADDAESDIDTLLAEVRRLQRV